MRNAPVRWLIVGTAAIFSISSLLYVFPPTKGRAFSEKSPVTTTQYYGGTNETSLW